MAATRCEPGVGLPSPPLVRPPAPCVLQSPRLLRVEARQQSCLARSHASFRWFTRDTPHPPQPPPALTQEAPSLTSFRNAGASPRAHPTLHRQEPQGPGRVAPASGWARTAELQDRCGRGTWKQDLSPARHPRRARAPPRLQADQRVCAQRPRPPGHRAPGARSAPPSDAESLRGGGGVRRDRSGCTHEAGAPRAARLGAEDGTLGAAPSRARPSLPSLDADTRSHGPFPLPLLSVLPKLKVALIL